MLINQIRKANERKKFNWKEHIVTMAGIASMTLIILGLMIFWQDIAAPALKMTENINKISDRQQKTVEVQSDILDKIQRIQQTENIPEPPKEKPPN